jgi:peptidoglycan hydrolase-like protein with peptidoglycan-binding domain
MSNVVKRGSDNIQLVRQIQQFLHIAVDGNFGPKTERFVVAWQSENGLVADGIVGRKTLESMGILDTDYRAKTSITKTGLRILPYHLDKNQYITQELPILNDYVMIHHTAGHANPYNQIVGWNNDNLGRIATEFIIGGPDAKTGIDTYDGAVLQAFPEGSQAWHIGKVGSSHMVRHTVGIELCNFGYLDDNFETYVGTQVKPNQLVTLKEEFRGFKHWHKYSDEQLKSLKKLLLHIGERDNIELRVGLIDWVRQEGAKGFEFKHEAYQGKVKGLLTHTNVRKDKYDCSPQPELLDMLLSI